jgi:hypothetical protein
VLHLVEPQRVYPPDTSAAMTAAFDRLCASIPKLVNGDDLRRQLALIILRHVDRGVQDPERLSEMAFRERAGPQRLGVGALANRSRSRLRRGGSTPCRSPRS